MRKLWSLCLIFVISSLLLSCSVLHTLDANSSELIGYWNFDENTGDTAHDLSGNRNDGTIHYYPEWTSGVSGSALKISVERQYFTVSLPNGTNHAKTLSAWIKFTSYPEVTYYGNDFGILCYADLGNNAIYDIGIEKTDKQYYLYSEFRTNESLALKCTFTDNSIELNKWYFVALVYDNEKIYVYVDNNYRSSDYWTGGYSQPISNSFAIGSLNSEFRGAVDEVKIYNCALSNSEVNNDFIAFSSNVQFAETLSILTNIAIFLFVFGLIITLIIISRKMAKRAKQRKMEEKAERVERQRAQEQAGRAYQEQVEWEWKDAERKWRETEERRQNEKVYREQAERQRKREEEKERQGYVNHSSGEDPFSILGVQRNATQAEVKAAFRKLSMEWHPDKYAKYQDDRVAQMANERFSKITNAYEEIKKSKGWN